MLNLRFALFILHLDLIKKNESMGHFNNDQLIVVLILGALVFCAFMVRVFTFF